MAYPPRKSSTFALQSRLQDDITKDAGFDLNLFIAHDTPLFEGYSSSATPYLPDFSAVCSKPESDCEDNSGSSSSSDEDDDIDPYRFHTLYPMLIPPQDPLTYMESRGFDDTPYLPTGELRDFSVDFILPFDEPTAGTESAASPSPTPVHFEVSESADAPTIPTPSIADAIIFRPSTRATHADNSHTDITSDEDAEGDSDYDPTDDDDEYVPDMEYPTSKKRRAFSQFDRLSPDTPLSSSYPSSSPSHARTSCSSSRESSVVSNSGKRPRASFPCRNLQATSNNTLKRVNKSDPWACPIQGCAWIQRNRRSPDLKRHIKTHTRNTEPAEWVCCGVHVDKAKYYERDASETPYDFRGKLMVGGCMKTFARRDALKRHLDNQNIRCVGDLNCYFD